MTTMFVLSQITDSDCGHGCDHRSVQGVFTSIDGALAEARRQFAARKFIDVQERLMRDETSASLRWVYGTHDLTVYNGEYEVEGFELKEEAP